LIGRHSQDTSPETLLVLSTAYASVGPTRLHPARRPARILASTAKTDPLRSAALAGIHEHCLRFGVGKSRLRKLRSAADRIRASA
jgi:hypothetical protein